MAIGEESSWLSSTAVLAQRKASRQVSDIVRCCSGLSGNASRWVHPEGVSVGCKAGDVPDEPRQWSAFEYADLMEQGLSGGLASSFISAPDKDAEVRLCVKRSPDRKEFLLTTEDGANLLLARLNENGEGFSIFVTADGEPPRALGPAFTLTSNSAKDRWTLQANICDQCESRGRRVCGSRELLYISHYTEETGHGSQGQTLCMDVELPAISQAGTTDIWCPTCKRQDAEQECLELTTRRPKWNARRKTLSLDFFGRCSLASARNFQLAVVDKPEKVRLLFGKVGTDQYVLDFQRPLSTIQAFGAAVSTSVWR